ncbi:MAG: recombinase family protein [Ruminococcus flavefaciens]|nr:recombinase family protein [Ruminococcus flavefaciens]
MTKRAVAYIRVSTKSDAQAHSYEFQKQYWLNTLTARADCDYVGLYCDHGISGRSLSKRPQLLRLIADAKQHKFDEVYTKSVSRFGRNTEELLETVRELRENGVKVFFEKEQIDTSNPTSEAFLTIAAMMAEAELKTCSDNMKWSVRNRFKDGWYSVGHGIFGYRVNQETKQLEIEPTEAETVRRMFDLYLQGYGTVAIGMILEKENRPNSWGKVHWNRGAIMYMLTNEKYKGSALSQKYIQRNGVCRVNKDEAVKYYNENTHEAIIPKETFEKVQAEIARRGANQKGKIRPTYAFSRKLICGVCGHGYVHKINSCGKPWANPIWICSHQNIYGTKDCDNRRIKDSVLKEKFVECFNEFVANKPESDETIELRARLKTLIESEKQLTVLRINRMIDTAAFFEESASIRKEMDEVSAQIAALEMRGIAKEDFVQIAEYDEDKVEKFIERVTICNNVVTFVFINGAAISREYTNGPSGNQKGWVDKRNARLEKENKTEVYNADSSN